MKSTLTVLLALAVAANATAQTGLMTRVPTIVAMEFAAS